MLDDNQPKRNRLPPLAVSSWEVKIPYPNYSGADADKLFQKKRITYHEKNEQNREKKGCRRWFELAVQEVRKERLGRLVEFHT